ncbi:hypothetical protein C8R45DRAFT_947096 [Mycena sanguinolenta]|nr:hypothetical protein C8R45DRAFT_947096 [Mycena sanguinolenta]
MRSKPALLCRLPAVLMTALMAARSAAIPTAELCVEQRSEFLFEIKLENILALVQVGAACLYYNLYWVDWDQIGFLKCRSYFSCRQSTRLIRIELTGIIREAAVSPHQSGGYACMAGATESASKCFTSANLAPITQLLAYYTHLEPGDKVQRRPCDNDKLREYKITARLKYALRRV